MWVTIRDFRVGECYCYGEFLQDFRFGQPFLEKAFSEENSRPHDMPLVVPGGNCHSLEPKTLNPKPQTLHANNA